MVLKCYCCERLVPGWIISCFSTDSSSFQWVYMDLNLWNYVHSNVHSSEPIVRLFDLDQRSNGRWRNRGLGWQQQRQFSIIIHQSFDPLIMRCQQSRASMKKFTERCDHQFAQDCTRLCSRLWLTMVTMLNLTVFDGYDEVIDILLRTVPDLRNTLRGSVVFWGSYRGNASA